MRTAGLGVAAAAHADVLLDLPAHHPSASGPLLLQESGELRVDLAHRGVELLMQSRDLRQCTSLASRHAWLSGISSEVGLCEVVESMLGLVVPPRAVWLRALWCELIRITHHLSFVGSMLAWNDPAPAGLAEREALTELLREVTGVRVHHSASCVGGVSFDVTDSWATRLVSDLPGTGQLRDALDPRWRGLGVLTAQEAHAWCVSGPVARASGVREDLRAQAAAAPYDKVTVPVVSRTDGDVLARMEVLLDEIDVSVELCRQLVAGLPAGDVRVRTPKTLRAPEGTGYAATEAPGGVNGWWLVSRGGPTPWRLVLATAGWGSAQALPSVLRGCAPQDVGLIVGSMLLISGDLAR
jgi:NADH-quinone oxidoreductase subunit D